MRPASVRSPWRLCLGSPPLLGQSAASESACSSSGVAGPRRRTTATTLTRARLLTGRAGRSQMPASPLAPLRRMSAMQRQRWHPRRRSSAGMIGPWAIPPRSTNPSRRRRRCMWTSLPYRSRARSSLTLDAGDVSMLAPGGAHRSVARHRRAARHRSATQDVGRGTLVTRLNRFSSTHGHGVRAVFGPGCSGRVTRSFRAMARERRLNEHHRVQLSAPVFRPRLFT
mmetsp:Transcript_18978/g.43166  ORF Transcript_18978/g.43166 Transcript_18978/m.43166 type:complete len:226 (-) Transcript_18978:33-710(-)